MKEGDIEVPVIVVAWDKLLTVLVTVVIFGVLYFYPN